MLNKAQIKDILKVGATLCAITAVSALILAFINSMTAPVIAKNNAQKQAKAMQTVLPAAVEFSDENLISKGMEEIVTAIYEGKDKNEAVCGYAVMVSPNGYGGELSIAVGVDKDLKVTGIDVIAQSETAGLGAKCTTDEFKSQYIGKTKDITVVKRNAQGNQIDAISSATITSKAVTSGVNTAIKAVESIKED